jgi:hypothetical protein
VAALQRGDIRFVLADDTTHQLDVDRGVVTERLVQRAAREQRVLRVGPRAVVTPLARDRARALGVTIERSHQGRETR